MKSFRSMVLPPDNMNQPAIHIFSGVYGVGIYSPLFFPDDFVNGPVDISRFGPVGSFLITGQADVIPTNPQDQLVPVFKLFPSGTPDPLKPPVCFILRNDNSASANKFHFQGTMNFDDENGVPTTITVGAIDYRSYDQISDDPRAFCPKSVDVRGTDNLGFIPGNGVTQKQKIVRV